MNRKNLRIAIILLTAFVLWTIAVSLFDIQPIGPGESSVGFASLNGPFHRLTGVHMTLYTITDWLGLVPVGVCMAFGALGLVQWIKRKSILKVDFSIIALGGFYIAVIAAYIFFEKFVVNYRPVLIEGYLEASYPSSTTMLTMCVMPTAATQLNRRINHSIYKRCILLVIYAFTAFMVVGRLISGVHWLSDIIGGALLSTGLIMLYRSICNKNIG